MCACVCSNIRVTTSVCSLVCVQSICATYPSSSSSSLVVALKRARANKALYSEHAQQHARACNCAMHVSELLCDDECSSPVRVQPTISEYTKTRKSISEENYCTRPTKRTRWETLPRRPYKKFYANATPSSHCHVCARTAKSVKFAICSRLQAGLCRKVICDKCFGRFGWNWENAINDPNWVCPHCRDACPPGRSQCFIYARVNRKRETKRAARAKAAAQAQKLRNSGDDSIQQLSHGYEVSQQMNQYLPTFSHMATTALNSSPVQFQHTSASTIIHSQPPPLGVLPPVLPSPSSLLLQHSSSWLLP